MDTLPDDPLKVNILQLFWRQISVYLLNQAGEQYFLDLGGNIKKGPTSKSSSCYCGPAFQKFEKKLEKDKQVNGSTSLSVGQILLFSGAVEAHRQQPQQAGQQDLTS